MPHVWQQLAEYRRSYGDEHVRQCIERGIAGEADWFFAFEAGHFVGTPFTSEAVQLHMRCVVALGGKFAVAIRPREGAPGA